MYPSFLDVEAGISFCDNDEEFYREMLATYVEGDKCEILREAFDNEDYDTYRRLVHSIKSTSLMIGAKDLYSYAKRIEDSLLEGNQSYAKQEYHTFMKSYHEVIAILQVYLGMSAGDEEK